MAFTDGVWILAPMLFILKKPESLVIAVHIDWVANTWNVSFLLKIWAFF
jgi:hypothetical protein